MPTTIPKLGTERPPGNRKVMVYDPANVHRATGQLALEEDRRISSAYVEAARAFLEARGREVDLDPSPITPPPASATSELVEAIDRQGRRIEELQAVIEEMQVATPRNGPGLVGTKAAEAMRELLAILKAAGSKGMTTRELTDAASAAGIKSGAAETAKAVLRGAGLVRCEGRWWCLDGV